MTHNTTAAELEKLLAETTPGPWYALIGYSSEINSDSGDWVVREFQETVQIREPDSRLIAMSPTLARKVIAAEKLVEVVKTLSLGCYSMDVHDEICLALAAWEQAQ